MTTSATTTHRIAWYVWAWGPDGSHQRMRHTRTMRGTWGWDAECSCGWQTRTGGATKGYVSQEVWAHKAEHNLHPWQQTGEEAPARTYREDTPGWLTRDDDAAEAVRYYKSEGASFSGWVVRSTTDPHSYSDPIPTKAEAIEALLTWD